MTPIADMVQRMLEKGVAHEAIVIAVEGAELAMSATIPRNSTGIPVDEVAEKRRAYDRERKRKSTGIPPDSTGIPRNSENASLSKEERIESKEGSKRETTRGARLPVGWTPTSQDWVVACELLSEPRAKSELEKFTDHWKQQPGSRGVKLDWNAAWRNWVRRAAEYAGAKNGKRTVHDAARDLTKYLKALDEPAPELREREGGSPLRLLPPGRRE